MASDDDEVKKPKAHEVGMPLDALSVEELQGRVELLEAEIARLKAAMDAKRRHKDAAASVFKL
jgi:uncharacterized small protein (DUF1192 family)